MDGILLIDKPAGITSAEVVRRIKARVKPDKVGHLGTLDPFATGLLPIMVGQATKLAPFLEGVVKEYTGTIALGTETDTLDPDGQVVNSTSVPELNAEVIRDVSRRFIGDIKQVPPIFSAIKRAGVPLYKLARRGDEVAPAEARTVIISELQLELVERSTIRLRVVCSPGTYVRALARDIGAALGCAAHLGSLRRVRSSGFSIAEACSLDETLQALGSDGVVDIVGIRQALPDMAEIEVDDEIARRTYNGDALALRSRCEVNRAPFKVICADRLVAIARNDVTNCPKLLRVFT